MWLLVNCKGSRGRGLDQGAGASEATAAQTAPCDACGRSKGAGGSGCADAHGHGTTAQAAAVFAERGWRWRGALANGAWAGGRRGLGLDECLQDSQQKGDAADGDEEVLLEMAACSHSRSVMDACRSVVGMRGGDVAC